MSLRQPLHRIVSGDGAGSSFLARRREHQEVARIKEWQCERRRRSDLDEQRPLNPDASEIEQTSATFRPRLPRTSIRRRMRSKQEHHFPFAVLFSSTLCRDRERLHRSAHLSDDRSVYRDSPSLRWDIGILCTASNATLVPSVVEQGRWCGNNR